MKKLLYIFLAFSLVCLFIGCKTMYVPVESVKTEYRDRNLHDSIFIRDSIHIREKGDTVWLTRWRTEYIEKTRVDSFSKIDSVPVPYPVEKKLNRWQKIKMDIGGLAIGAILITILVLPIFLRKRRK